LLDLGLVPVMTLGLSAGLAFGDAGLPAFRLLALAMSVPSALPFSPRFALVFFSSARFFAKSAAIESRLSKQSSAAGAFPPLTFALCPFCERGVFGDPF
jgi:hypothetical protein